MFPIENAAGDVVAFGARKLPDEDGPKYLNSRATEIYDKSSLLYNLHRAGNAARETDRIVVVEGYLDAIAAHAAGIEDVVALCGTALTRRQAEEVKACARNVVLNLDADDAGRRAAIKHAEGLLANGLRVRALDLAGDPAEYVARNGAAAYRREMNHVRPFIEWLACQARGHYDVTTAEGKTDAIHSIISSLQRVPADERRAMATEIAAYLEVPEIAEKQPNKHLEHIAAWDFAIAPHKSYSVTALVGGDQGIIEDHKEAVRIALDAGEKYTQARLGNNKVPFTTANWAAALFLHDTARPVEGRAPNPHLHTHAVVFNMTHAGDKIRSVQAHEWYRIQSYISAIYQTEMAYRARKRGYELEHGRNFSTRIKGYTEEYLRAVSARTEEIEKEKAEKGLIGAEADERVNKRLREAKQAWDPPALWQEHRRQAEEYGNHPDRVVEAARGRKPQSLSDSQRSKLAQESIDYARHRLYEGQAVIDHYELIRDALRFGLGHLRLEDVEAAFEQRLAHEEKEFVEVHHYRETAPGARYTTREMRGLEIGTIGLVCRQQGSMEPIAPHLTRDQFRAEYKQRMRDGRKITLNDAQMWMAYKVLTARDQYMIVRGAAGVGKSTAMQPIAEMAYEHAGYRVHGVASTGVAANNLAEIGIPSETIQSHLLRGVDASAPKRLYILDEGSLIGTRQFHEFCRTVRAEDRVIIAYDPRQHQSVEAGRIVEELEQAGVTTFRLEKILRQRHAPELLAVVEKFAKGEIREGLEMLDDQNRVWEVPDRKKRFAAMASYYAEHHTSTLIVSPDNRSLSEINAAVRHALRERNLLGENSYQARVLVSLRDVRTADRKRAVTYEPGNVIRWGKAVAFLGVASGQYCEVKSVNADANTVTILIDGPAGRREQTYDPRQAWGVEIFEADTRWLAPGDKVQVTRPWKVSKGLKIANRSVGVIRAIDAEGNCRLELQPNGANEHRRAVQFRVRDMPHLEYSYAMTSYAQQSKTGEKVLVQLDTGDSRIRTLIDKPLVYVGASRGEKDILIFTDDREHLLSEYSPVNRVALKPKALCREEIADRAYSMSVGLAS